MAKIQKSDVKEYPDVSKLFRSKEKRRVEFAKLPIEEKLERSKKIRDAMAMIKRSTRVGLK